MKECKLFLAKVGTPTSDELYVGFGRPMEGKYVLMPIEADANFMYDINVDGNLNHVGDFLMDFDPARDLFDRTVSVPAPKDYRDNMDKLLLVIRTIVQPENVGPYVDRLGINNIRAAQDKFIQEIKQQAAEGEVDERTAYERLEKVYESRQGLEQVLKDKEEDTNQSSMLEEMRKLLGGKL